MSYFVVDVEADGPYPGDYSMVCFGVVKVDDRLDKTFYGQTKPISLNYKPDSLAISGFSRKEHEKFDDPLDVMLKFTEYIQATTVGYPIFITDNPAFDFAYMNYYFHKYIGKNPFGFSGRRIGDLYCGLVKDTRKKWKHLRKTVHDHHPVNDAKGNAEVLLHMRDEMGLKIKLI